MVTTVVFENKYVSIKTLIWKVVHKMRVQKGLENSLEKGLQNIIEFFKSFQLTFLKYKTIILKNNIFYIMILYPVEETISYNLK